MLISVGSPVVSARGFAGYVTATCGAPGGDTEYLVTSVGRTPQQRWLREEQLSPRPAPEPATVGSVVRCYAQDCEVLGHDALSDTYDLIAVLRLPPGSDRPSPLGHVEVLHHYPAVPAHHLALWSEG